MSIRWTVLATMALISMMASTDQLSATEIYKWVDEDGVTHYTSQLPEEAVPDLKMLEIKSTDPDDYDPLLHEYSILNQAKRLPPREIRKKDTPPAREKQEEYKETDRDEYEQASRGDGYPIVRYVTPAYYPGFPYKRHRHGVIGRPLHGTTIDRHRYKSFSPHRRHSAFGQHANEHPYYVQRPRPLYQSRFGYRTPSHRHQDQDSFHLSIQLGQRRIQQGPRHSTYDRHRGPGFRK